MTTLTDHTFILALVISCGLNVLLYARWRRASSRERQLGADRDWAFRRIKNQDQTIQETLERLSDTEAALHAKVAAETRGGDGPVAA